MGCKTCQTPIKHKYITHHYTFFTNVKTQETYVKSKFLTQKTEKKEKKEKKKVKHKKNKKYKKKLQKRKI